MFPLKSYILLGCLCLVVFPTRVSATALTEEEALRLTLERDPRLAAMREAHLAVTGRRLGEDDLPNPELEFEIENIRFGDGPESRSTVRDPGGAIVERSQESVSDSGFDGSEFTLSVSQLIELGGKRARRIALADDAIQVALWDYEVERAAAIARTRAAFVDALAAQELLAVHTDLAKLAEESFEAAAIRVDSGRDSPILRDRAEIEHAQARIELAAASRAVTTSRFGLAAQWDDVSLRDGAEPAFDAVSGDLYSAASIADRAGLREALTENPHLARWAAEVTRRNSALALERANRVIDLTVSLGWRGIHIPDSESRDFDAGGDLSAVTRTRPEDEWDHSVVFGLSVPIPLFSQNRGAIAEAEHLALQASHEQRAAYTEAWAQVAAVHGEVEAAHAEMTELRDTVLLAAERAYDAARVGFEGGKFTYLDVLDSQRTLFRARIQYVEASRSYRRGVIEIERLTGTHEELATPEGAQK